MAQSLWHKYIAQPAEFIYYVIAGGGEAAGFITILLLEILLHTKRAKTRKTWECDRRDTGWDVGILRQGDEAICTNKRAEVQFYITQHCCHVLWRHQHHSYPFHTPASTDWDECGEKKEMKITMPPLKEGYVTVTVTVWAEIMNFLRLANYHQDMLCVL